MTDKSREYAAPSEFGVVTPGDLGAGETGVFARIVSPNVMVPMRDGVRLATDIHRPARGIEPVPGRLPVILIRTSIGKEHSEWRPVLDFFPARGYAVVIQDLRSRHSSEGDGRYYHASNEWDGDDGYDTIEWIAAQAWSDGRIGMMGSSHRAMVQTQAAIHDPPHLVTICPEQGPTYQYHQNCRTGGAMALHMFAAPYMHGIEAQEIRDRPDDVQRLMAGIRDLRRWLLRSLEGPFKPGEIPLSAAPCLEETFFKYYYRGEYDDDWWGTEANHSARHFPRHKDMPCLITGGWFDPYVDAATGYFQAMREKGGSYQKLIIGPWTHGSMRTNVTWAGDVDFGPDSMQGQPKHSELRLRWFDRWLKGVQNGLEREAPVDLFVMGGGTGEKDKSGRMLHGGRWRSESDWPLARTEFLRLHLRADGRLTEVSDGKAEQKRSFTFDPRQPVPTAGGAIASFIEAVPLETGKFPATPPYGERLTTFSPFFRLMTVWGPVHQAEAEWQLTSRPPYRQLRERPDVLAFETPPLTQDLEVTGNVKVVLWVSSSAVDTDFTAKLVDVYPALPDYPDGYHMLLCDSVLRCRYRNSWTNPELMKPGEVYRIEMPLPATSNLFKAGHRIRVDISSSNFPRFDVNPNTGEPVGRHKLIVQATNTVWMDSSRQSHIVLPIIR